MAEIGQDIFKCKEILEKGGLVAIPTETVYGLAANALNPDAVAKIFKAKNRPSFDPLIVHTDSLEKLKSFTTSLPLDFELLLRKFSPGPLTLLLPKRESISDLVTSGLPRVAVRIPNHDLSLSLLKSIDFPLAAPSANPFGYISPTTAEHVNKQLGDKIDYILDGGPCSVGLESTIIGYEGEQITVYRKGGLAIEQIESVVGTVDVLDYSSSNPAAPGMLKSHYAPNKEVLLLPVGNTINFRERCGILRYSEFSMDVEKGSQFVLTEKKDLIEAAQNLFKGLRHLDGLDIDTIYLELVPDEGIGRAINDRLKRAAAVV
ncbi:MAG: L-threonylcarbamoyladenylate synthase [Cytophagales bacterium]|nr:L-threonylcarbamoyladenylate synthase [Cytophagales bacterium]